MKKLILAVLVLIWVGCINYTSVTKIEEDGSGSLTIMLEMPQIEDAYISVVELEVKDSIQGWKPTLMTTDTLDRSIVYRLEGNFESPDVLARVFNMDAMVFEKEEAGDAIRYHLKRPPVFLPGGHLQATFESTRSLFKASIKYGSDDYLLVEKMVLPGKIIEHNSTTRKGDTLIWETSLLDLITQESQVDVTWEVK